MIAGWHSTGCKLALTGLRPVSSSALSGRFCKTAGSTAYSYTRCHEAASLHSVPSDCDADVDQFSDWPDSWLRVRLSDQVPSPRCSPSDQPRVVE
jgi:hypothetical protein